MRRTIRQAAPLALVLLLGCYAAEPTQRVAPEPTPENDAVVKVGKPAPALEGTDTDGKKVSLSDYRGKVVLVDFWMTG
jgi:cytochrome oxidase Cu insertion factor (SCO1/SenC/PrrC family)